MTLTSHKPHFFRFIEFMEQTDLQKISELTLSYINNSPNTDNAYHRFLRELYKQQQLSSVLVTNPWDKLDENNPTIHFEKSSEWLDDHSQGIDHFLTQHGLAFKLVPMRIGSKGGKGNKVHYSLKKEAVEASAKAKPSERSYPVPKGGVRFEVVKSESGWWKDNKDISLAGSKKWVFLAFCLSPLIVLLGTILFWQTTGNALYIFPCLLLPLVSMPFYMMLHNGAYLRIFRNNTLMFIGTNKDGDRSICFRTYKGKCNVCGANLILDKGWSILGSKRIIALCRDNSALHKFTIDHVTNTGERLKYL